MPFQPFGYPFEVRSRLPVDEAKAAIRAKKKRWFDVTNGARGWSAGPFLCLWASAFDRYGPMVLARIEQDGFGSRVRGRAGSDLNGMILTALMCAAFLFVLIQLFEQNGGSLVSLIPLGSFFLAVAALVFWFGHKDRKDADGLVRFLRHTLGEIPSPRPLKQRKLGPVDPQVELTTDGDSMQKITEAAQVYSLVDQLERGEIEFIVMQRSEQEYMQTACRYSGFVLELRKGGEDRHFHALRTTERERRRPERDEVAESLLCYLEGRENSAPVEWEAGCDTGS